MTAFDFSSLLSAGLPPPAARWTGLAKYNFTGGNNDADQVPVDGFELDTDDGGLAVLHNDRFELTLFRRPEPGPRPAIGLTATWDGKLDPVVLAAVREP